jgi:hypothetical protein
VFHGGLSEMPFLLNKKLSKILKFDKMAAKSKMVPKTYVFVFLLSKAQFLPRFQNRFLHSKHICISAYLVTSERPGCFDGYGRIGILIKPLWQNGRNFEGHAPGNGKAIQTQNSRLESF